VIFRISTYKVLWVRECSEQQGFTLQTWQQTSQDPNDPKLLEFRRAEIMAARQANLVSDRHADIPTNDQGTNSGVLILDQPVVISDGVWLAAGGASS
jgi:hypothetical protein